LDQDERGQQQDGWKECGRDGVDHVASLVTRLPSLSEGEQVVTARAAEGGSNASWRWSGVMGLSSGSSHGWSRSAFARGGSYASDAKNETRAIASRLRGWIYVSRNARRFAPRYVGYRAYGTHGRLPWAVDDAPTTQPSTPHPATGPRGGCRPLLASPMRLARRSWRNGQHLPLPPSPFQYAMPRRRRRRPRHMSRGSSTGTSDPAYRSFFKHAMPRRRRLGRSRHMSQGIRYNPIQSTAQRP
jgi:hypothetical protein